MKGMIMKIHMSVTLCLAACLAGSLSWARTVHDLSGAGWTADGAPVTIPHSWNVEDGTDGKGFPPHERLALNSSCASGYERKTVVYARALPAKRPGKRYFVRFEGASIFTTVSVNGKPVGTHNGAFTAFAFEITDALTDGESRLEVAVDNHVQTNAPPVNADFTMYGGLYRGVELIETDPVCIDPVTDGASGVVVHADASSGRVKVDVSLLGSDEAAFSCRVTGPGFDQVFEGLEFTVPNPHLWSPETPSLYTLEVTVRADGSTDTVAERFGFRTVEFKSDGFYLNGRRRFVRGVNHNQDRFGQGWALSAKDHREDLEAIRALGADGIRTTVYPHAQLVYDLCDELGLLAWIETPNVNGLRFTEAFRSNVWAQAREMVAQYRNHPSIIVWGIFNELYNKVPMKEGDPESMMEELRDYIHGLDPSRRVAAVSCEPQKRRLNAVPDVLGFNRYPGWYVGEATDMRGMVDEIVRETGRTTFAMTEYGAGAGTATHGPLRGRVVPRSDFHPMEYQAYIHCEDYRCLRADPRVWGAFVWCMFDFGSDCRLEGEHHGVNDKGLVGFDHRTKKDAYWFYRANWTDDPVLHLVGATADTAPSPTPDILVFCNTGRVTLSINGREVGALDPDEVKSCRWDGVVLDEGDNAVTIRSGDRERTVMWWNPKTERPRFTVESQSSGAVQAAVDKAGAAGGGRVYVPKGDYPIAFLQLRDNVTLELAEGARLFAETNVLVSRAEFARREHNQNQALVVTKKAKNVGIVGKGVIDGLGQYSTPFVNDRPGRWKLVIFQDTDGIRLEGVSLVNSCSWTCYFQRCRNVTARGVTIDGHANYNNDGFDIEAQNVLLENCTIDCEDDSICGKIHDPDFVCGNVEVRDCRLSSNCNFIKLGTASLGLFRNWYVHDIRMSHARAAPLADLCWITRGIIPGVTNAISGMSAVALEAVDGGQIENIRVQNVDIGSDVHSPIFLRVGARKGEDGKQWYFRNVTIENLRGRSCSWIASSITGVPSRRLGGNVVLKDIDLVLRGGIRDCDWRKPVPECEKNYPESNAFGTVMPAYGFYLRHADGVRFENVRLRTDGPEPRPAIVQDDTTDVAFEGCDFQPGGNDPSAVARRIIDQFLSTEPERYLPEGFRGPAYLMEHPYGEDYHVHYAVVSLWANAIACARKMGDEALVKRLVSRFEPFYGEKKRLCTDLLHVDYTVFGALPLAIYLATGDMRARELGLRYADIQWAEPRKDDRLPHYDDRSYEERMNWWRMGFSGQTRLWIDDSYMIAFLQTQAWRADGDRRRLDRAAAEMAMYLEKLQLEDGLFHHAPEAPYRWARGNGWMAAGMALLLPLLPEDNPHRREILADYRRMMATLRKYQRPDGLWGQLVDEPDSWGETSGSAMFAFAFQNGINNGLLPANEYRDCVRKAYAAIVARMDEHGNVSDVCEGTGKKNDHAYYLSRSRVNGDPHGQASLLWLCAALWEAGQYKRNEGSAY